MHTCGGVYAFISMRSLKIKVSIVCYLLMSKLLIIYVLNTKITSDPVAETKLKIVSYIILICNNENTDTLEH